MVPPADPADAPPTSGPAAEPVLAADSTAAAGTTLDAEALAELLPHGVELDVDAGDTLFRAGDATADFFVVLTAEVQIVRPGNDGDSIVAVHGPGRFIGELNLLTGQRPYLTARVSQPGRMLRIELGEFRRIMSSKPDLADVIFRALAARREAMRGSAAADAIRIVGSRFSSDAMALRAFANRSHLVHTWIDLEDVDDADVMLAGLGLRPVDMPAVLTASGVLRRPTPGEFAEHLGLTFHPTPGYLFDLVVVGTGPAGLAASVYGASEGLTTVSLDAVAIGGQAGASSRIENYVGFPNGVSGGELVTRAAIQAQRLGARLNSPCEVTGLRTDNGLHVVMLADGSEIMTRAVIVASGARYQRLAVGQLERFEGAGVYYAATDLEARVCAGLDAIVIGGGNSAGQAAIYLAQQGSRVSIAIRRDGLEATMSRYLIERIEADDRIELLTRTEVRELAGGEHLERVTLEHHETGERREVPCAALFCFIGAQPATAWLGTCVELDAKGFILTDRALPDSGPARALFVSRDPLPFETSRPGVFAVGDVRNGSLKRVAAAVGEGSSAVRSVHEHLASGV
jgi:thioredoxin reductase (NADPH)